MSDVWKKLSVIDCSKHVEKKGQLSYLSWTWAWSVLMEHYPSSSYVFHPETSLDNGSVMVSCTVTVEGQSHTMWLPVMDNRNNSITNPDTRKISDARMRCLVKAIAMHGLGIYIYAGEDLPEAPAPKALTDDEKEAARIAQRTPEYNAAITKYASTIEAVISGINNSLAAKELNDLDSQQSFLSVAAEAWFTMEKQDDLEDAQRSIWLAYTKGGVFTTQQQAVIKSSDFRIAYFGA